MQNTLLALGVILAFVLVLFGAFITHLSVWFWVANGVSFLICVVGGYFIAKKFG